MRWHRLLEAASTSTLGLALLLRLHYLELAPTMQLFSWIRRFFASIMPSRQPSLYGHWIYGPRTEGTSASYALAMVEQFHRGPELLGHLVVVKMQLWKEKTIPGHEFIVARVVQVKEADSLPPIAKGSELASMSILIGRNERQGRYLLQSSSRLLSSEAPTESATSASQHDSADAEPILDSHIHSKSAPDLPSGAHTQEDPPASTDDANPVLADDDDDAKNSIASSSGVVSLIPPPAYDRFDMYPHKSIKYITRRIGAVCMASMNFTTASRPLLFEELAMMAKVTSESVIEYTTPTTHAYWYAASVWGMVILHTGAKPEGITNRLRLRVGASKGVSLPAHVFGVDDELKPAELLKTFLPKWDRYKAGLIQRGKLREEEILRKIEAIKKDAAEAINEAESRAQEAEDARKELVKENAELKRMLAQLDGTTSA
ncbi:hypothetical protein CYLTODRAFT_489639 [Cylindrobasidium torrendii FP15055 ss-10]|uniref:Uncharacterized protein n=1 Tax=Cylindrobasidium torrendii FP15055 ss-10 TaxID=1314674 RepID=A0A0D7BG54_9AGAR|nr:hypothetical protein CYLTODRAFT_489639 [Cylindrobasidium torrendii FP15055 ss-10]